MKSVRRDLLTEVSMGKGFTGCDTFPMIVPEKLVKQVQSFVRDIGSVFLSYKVRPRDLRVTAAGRCCQQNRT